MRSSRSYAAYENRPRNAKIAQLFVAIVTNVVISATMETSLYVTGFLVITTIAAIADILLKSNPKIVDGRIATIDNLLYLVAIVSRGVDSSLTILKLKEFTLSSSVWYQRKK